MLVIFWHIVYQFSSSIYLTFLYRAMWPPRLHIGEQVKSLDKYQWTNWPLILLILVSMGQNYNAYIELLDRQFMAGNYLRRVPIYRMVE